MGILLSDILPKEGITMKTPVTQQRLRDHFTYSWWKYVLLVIISFMLWSIAYAMTTPRAPEEKKIIVGLYGSGTDANLDDYMLEVQRIHLPEMEEMSPMDILPDATYGDMILTTRMIANECDIYILPTTQFQNWAGQGACQPLDEVLPELISDLEEAGISLSRGRRLNTDTQEKHIYGIPCRDLPGAMNLLWCDPTDLYICVYHNTGNDENVLKFMDIFIRDLMNEPPSTPTDLAPAQ